MAFTWRGSWKVICGGRVSQASEKNFLNIQTVVWPDKAGSPSPPSRHAVNRNTKRTVLGRLATDPLVSIYMLCKQLAVSPVKRPCRLMLGGSDTGTVKALIGGTKEDTKMSTTTTQRPTLRLGATGDYVKQAQALLNKHGATLTVDGDFGANTSAAVMAFQRANGLAADATIGGKTWAALDAATIAEPMPVGRAADFITYLKACVGDIYVWGAQGQSDITEAWIRRMSRTNALANAAIKLWQARVKFRKDNLRAFDCSGLIMYYLRNLKGYITRDMTADGLYRLCIKITRAQLQPGDLVFRRNLVRAYHVGVYIGNGQVIEAQSSAYGVVMRSIDAGGTSYWTHFGRLAVLEG